MVGVLCFDGFSFDFEERVLRRDGEPVALQPQPTQALAILLESPGRLVPREELKARIWEGRVVEFDPGLNFTINQVRRALGDNATTPRYVETVHRRGYRFIAEVSQKGEERSDTRRAHDTHERRRAPVGVLASIVVAGSMLWAGWQPRSTPGDVTLAALPEPVRTTFLAARYLFQTGETDRALVRLDSVRLSQPDFAEAWVLTARARQKAGDLPGARAAAEQALALKPTLPEGLFTLGRIAFDELRGDEALRAFAEASRLAPDGVQYRIWYAETLADQLRFDEAIEQLEAARRLDPVSNLVAVDLAFVYIAAGRLDDALTYCASSLELVKDAEPWARNCLLTAHHFKGEDRLAVVQARALMKRYGAGEAETGAVSVLPDYFRWDLTRLDQSEAAGKSVNPYDRVSDHAGLEDRDETLRGLRHLQETKSGAIRWAPRDAWFWFLHGDPEFEAILRDAGVPIPGAANPLVASTTR